MVRAQSEYYYVDKTLLIKDFLDQKPLVSLFTRPRKIWKNFDMDMIRVFFETSMVEIRLNISKIKKSGIVAKNIVPIKGNIPLFFLRLRM